MRQTVLILLLVPICSGICGAQTPVDVQPVKKLERGNTLGTCGYTPKDFGVHLEETK